MGSLNEESMHTMKTRIIGDIHGKVASYAAIADESEKSIQIGDFGFGFFDRGSYHERSVHEFFDKNPQHRFIRGNHDDPARCREVSNFVEDGTVENKTMFIGGAWSIDYLNRHEGISWWRDEECSEEQFVNMTQGYIDIKPKIMITHDAPLEASKKMFLDKGLGMGDNKQIMTMTGNALQHMFEIHQPDVWIYGHWHGDITETIKGTEFICLNELSYMDIEL